MHEEEDVRTAIVEDTSGLATSIRHFGSGGASLKFCVVMAAGGVPSVRARILLCWDGACCQSKESLFLRARCLPAVRSFSEGSIIGRV